MSGFEVVFWSLAAAVAAFTAVSLLRPLARPPVDRSRADAALAVYRDQAAEIERRRAASEMADDDAAAATREIKRRILAGVDDAAPRRRLSARGRVVVSIFIVAAALGGFGIYGLRGAPGVADAPLAGRDDAVMQAAQARAELGRLVARAAAKMADRGVEDVRGLSLLAMGYVRLGRAQEAAAVFGRLADREPEVARWPASRGAALVEVGRGRVTPGAQAAFEAALALDPTDGRARYFLALGALQNGDAAAALNGALALARDLPPDASMLQPLGDIVDAARAAMSAADPSGEMIDVMVDSLAARLADGSGTLAEWLRLGRAELTRGRPAAAAAAYRAALKIAPDDADAARGLAHAESALTAKNDSE